MGYGGKVKLQIKAIELRKKGYSIKQIERLLHISRSSASVWVRDVKLTDQQLETLYKNKTNGGLKGSYIASQNKIKKRIESTLRIKKTAMKEIGRLSNRDRFITGIALYFAEGNKTGHSVAFTNSDYRSNIFMVKWLKKFGKVPLDRFRLNLYLHDNLSESRVKQYWTNLLKIPISQFGKTYIVKNNPGRLRKTKHENGILRITVSDVTLHRRIMGWISGLLEL